jgi:protein-L-isoaspartate(D-aspartate) O-methyltransferase
MSDQDRMIEEQIKGRGITDPGVLSAMARVPRHFFVPEPYRDAAYEDAALPLDYRQTISQPYIVAFMTAQLRISASDRILEIGTGSGYQTAILACLAQTVYTVEIIPELSEKARLTLERLGYTNVCFRVGDGYAGWPAFAPYDGILVTAAPPALPVRLIDQLTPEGRMVVPVGTADQMIHVVTRTLEGYDLQPTISVRFVPMVSRHGDDRKG